MPAGDKDARILAELAWSGYARRGASDFVAQGKDNVEL